MEVQETKASIKAELELLNGKEPIVKIGNLEKEEIKRILEKCANVIYAPGGDISHQVLLNELMEILDYYDIPYTTSNVHPTVRKGFTPYQPPKKSPLLPLPSTSSYAHTPSSPSYRSAFSHPAEALRSTFKKSSSRYHRKKPKKSSQRASSSPSSSSSSSSSKLPKSNKVSNPRPLKK